jgi:DNA-binding NarL/FixJ family response regulator
VLIWCDALAEVRARLDAEIDTAQRLGSLPNFVALLATRAWLHLRAGEPREAEADARLSIGSPGAPRFFRAQALAFLIEALVERGELVEAERVAADCEVRDTVTDGLLLVARGRLHAAAGRPDAALADFLAGGAVMAATGIAGPAPTAWRSEAAVASLALGRTREARALADEELTLAQAFGTPRAVGIALRAAGMAYGDDGRLRAAVSTLSGSPAVLEHARALVELGAALRRAGRRRDAREPLAAALDTAHRRGARALAEPARTELLAAGARPRRAVLTGVESLTPSERRVALMAARGLTNRDIAQALFVTARTVEGHLTHVFQKLGVRSRAELTEALRAAD